MWGTSQVRAPDYADTFYYNCSLNILSISSLPILCITPTHSSWAHRDRQDKVQDLSVLAKQQQLK